MDVSRSLETHHSSDENPVGASTKLRLSETRLRSAIRGNDVLAPVDGRHLKRLRSLTRRHIADLGGDISHAEKILVGRASMLALLAEVLEAKFAAHDMQAKPQDLDSYQRVVNCLRRCLESLGLQRRARDVTPSLDEYLASKGLERGLVRPDR